MDSMNGGLSVDTSEGLDGDSSSDSKDDSENTRTETYVDWEIITVNSDGVIDWSQTQWGSISKYENLFGEDLNEDGGIGLSAALSAVQTDTFGVKLKRDEDKNLYIDLGDPDSEIIAITDEWGGSPRFDHTNTWGDSTNTSESFAVEKQEDGSFKLAIKHTNTWNSEVNIDWEVISISSTGKIDWNSTKWGGIAKQENYFKQDLNGDGGIGLAAALSAVPFDTTGSKLLRDSENSLYIDVDGDVTTTEDIIPIVDDYGWSPCFDHSDLWQGGSHKSESYAVEQQSDGSFKLAIKKTDNWGQEDRINWEVLSIILRNTRLAK